MRLAVLGDDPWYGPDPMMAVGPLGTCYFSPSLALTEGAPRDVDGDELRLLNEVFGVAGRDKHEYVTYKQEPAKKKKAKPIWVPVYDVKAYVADRTAFFGPDYEEYKTECIKELNADKEKLRKVVEPNVNDRKKFPRWKEAQNAFYCWVRKAIEDARDDEDVDVPAIIFGGKTKELIEALAKVQHQFKDKFKAGGYNPRPQKHGGKYILGTISDHALGTAVDVNDEENAQIVSGTWAAILKFTGKALDKGTRATKWDKDPKGLYDAIVEIDEAFVDKLAKLVEEAQKAIDEEAEKAAKAAAVKKVAAGIAAGAAGPAGAGGPVAGAAAAVPAVKKPDPLERVIATKPEVAAIGAKFVREWKDGFFALDWKLVEAFSDAGFTWGAVFSDVDLHHFQL